MASFYGALLVRLSFPKQYSLANFDHTGGNKFSVSLTTDKDLAQAILQRLSSTLSYDLERPGANQRSVRDPPSHQRPVKLVHETDSSDHWMRLSSFKSNPNRVARACHGTTMRNTRSAAANEPPTLNQVDYDDGSIMRKRGYGAKQPKDATREGSSRHRSGYESGWTKRKVIVEERRQGS